jgi:RNA polymerase sigma-70 factor, ECF subfamily
MKADLEIVKEVQTGQKSGFAELVKRHQTALLRLCLRMLKDQDLAEDVVQEAFIKAYKKIHLFEGRSSFKSWLYQIAMNTARNKFRENRLEVVSLEKIKVSVSPEAESNLVQTDVESILRGEVEKLPDRQREALVLRIYEDLSFKEIARIMDCPYDTAKANYRHGLMKIKESIEQNQNLREWSASDHSPLIEIANRFSEADT